MSGRKVNHLGGSHFNGQRVKILKILNTKAKKCQRCRAASVSSPLSQLVMSLSFLQGCKTHFGLISSVCAPSVCVRVCVRPFADVLFCNPFRAAILSDAPQSRPWLARVSDRRDIRLGGSFPPPRPGQCHVCLSRGINALPVSRVWLLHSHTFTFLNKYCILFF